MRQRTHKGELGESVAEGRLTARWRPACTFTRCSRRLRGSMVNAGSEPSGKCDARHRDQCHPAVVRRPDLPDGGAIRTHYGASWHPASASSSRQRLSAWGWLTARIRVARCRQHPVGLRHPDRVRAGCAGKWSTRAALGVRHWRGLASVPPRRQVDRTLPVATWSDRERPELVPEPGSDCKGPRNPCQQRRTVSDASVFSAAGGILGDVPSGSWRYASVGMGAQYTGQSTLGRDARSIRTVRESLGSRTLHTRLCTLHCGLCSLARRGSEAQGEGRRGGVSPTVPRRRR